MLFPEPGSWDRKEIYRERRPVKSESLGSSPVAPRWRDSPSYGYRGNQNHHGGGQREISRRGVTDFRRTPGRGRQQSDWHMFPEESRYGYMSSRSCERIVEDRGYWTPSSSQVDGSGRYRSATDYYKVRGYQKDWEVPGWQQNNSSSAVSGGKPYNGSPVYYGGRPCDEFSDIPVERRHNGIHHGFGAERHFNMSPVVSDGKPRTGFSGASVEKMQNGFAPRNGFAPTNGFSPRSEKPYGLSPAVSEDKKSFGYSSRNGFSPKSEKIFGLSPAVSGDKKSFGYYNSSTEKTRNGVSGHSVVKTQNRATPSIASEKPLHSSISISGDGASGRFSCSPEVNPFNEYSPPIAKPAIRPLNAAIESLRHGCSVGQAVKTDNGLSSSVSAERPIQFPSSISMDNSNLGLSGTSAGKTFENITSSLVDEGMPYHKPSSTPLANIGNEVTLHNPEINAHNGSDVAPEDKLCSSIGVSATDMCDGMARSVVAIMPLVNNDGKLSNIENEPKCVRVNTGCLNTWPENSPKHLPDIEPGEIHESGNTSRHDKENFLGTDWKPLIWTRSGSLSSRGHSTSSRSILVDSKAIIDGSLQINGTTLRSPVADTADCLAFSVTSGETHTSKKPRLGWGQGLARYEKKVVDDPYDGKKNDICSQKVGSKVTPDTPSPACSSLPDTGEKSLAEGNMPDTFYLGGSDPNPSSIKKLDMSFITTEVHLLLNMIHSEDQCPTGSSSCHESTNALSKLLAWKTGLLKAVEITDSDIELLESEVQSSDSRSGSNVHCPAASSSLDVNGGISSNKNMPVCNGSPMPTPLKVDSSMVREDIDSPGMTTYNPLVPSLKVEARLQVGNTRQDASTNGSHMMVELTHNCDADVPNNHDILEIEGSRLCEFIFAANKEVANKASGELAQPLLGNQTYVANCQEFANTLIRDEVAKRKKLLRFTERAATLKYRALQQLWKEDAQLLEIRKSRSKSSKRLESGTQTSQYAHLKSNILRSRVSSSEGSTKLVPSSQTVSLTSNLLSDFPVKVYKDELRMPPLVLDEKEKQMSRFVSYNGLVEDPVAVEKERSVMNAWTPDEKETFLDKFNLYGKNFRKIASYLEHKTTADCVEFYYKYHKSALFERTRKKPVRLGTKRKSTTKGAYMITSGDKWSQERVAANVLAGISGSLSSEVINPCVSGSFNHADVQQQWKRKKVGGKRKRTWSQEVVITPNNDEACSSESCGEMEFSALDWTDEEKLKLLEAVKLYGNNFELVSKVVKTRYINECKAFYSKVKKRLGLTQTATAAGVRLDSKPDIYVRLKTEFLEPGIL